MTLFRSLMLATAALWCFLASATSLSGRWSGELSLGAQQLKLTINITEQPAGTFSATLDVPAQGANGIACSSVQVSGDQVSIAIDAIGAKYDGKIEENGNQLSGTFAQSGMQLPLTLKREDMSKRQEPQPPYPYETREVTFGHDGITLAGTLTLPSGKGPHPAVLLVTGSGPQDRDETIFGHKPFLVIADYLTRHGIAVLRYDDRGVGGSSTASGYETTADLALDAQSGIEWLKKCDGIDHNRIGMLGHSEGGCIAIMSAPQCSFIITLAGPAVKGKDLMIAQNRMMVETQGGKWTPELQKQVTSIFTAIDTAQSQKSLESTLRGIMGDDPNMTAQISALTSPWYVHFVQHDPTEDLKRISCPMLALNGEWDSQVNCDQNLGAIRRLVPTAQVVALPGLNHALQECPSKAQSYNYAEIEQTISPVVLDRIADFIAKISK